MFIRKRKSRQLAGLGLGEVVDRCRRKREKLDRLKGGVFRGVSVVVRRELNLAKPMMLLAGFMILALGVGLGWWLKNPAADSKSVGHYLPVAQAKLRPPESGSDAVLPVIKPEPAADNSVAPTGGRQIQPSSSDTLLRGVRELLEKIKRGE